MCAENKSIDWSKMKIGIDKQLSSSSMCIHRAGSYWCSAFSLISRVIEGILCGLLEEEIGAPRAMEDVFCLKPNQPSSVQFVSPPLVF